MKTAKKIWLIISAVLCISGLVCCTVAVSMTGFNFDAFRKHDTAEQKTVTLKDSYQSISINCVSDDITIKRSENNETKIVYYENESNKCNITVEDHCLKINKTTVNHHWQFHFNIMDLFSNWGENEIVVYLPENEYQNYQIGTVSGDIKIENKIVKAQEIEFGTTSGDIALTAANAEKVKMITVSGDVKADISEGQELSVETTSGDIDFEKTAVNKITMHTVSGDIKGTTAGNYQYHTSTVSGDISVPVSSEQTDKTASFETVSGDVIIKNN